MVSTGVFVAFVGVFTNPNEVALVNESLRLVVVVPVVLLRLLQRQRAIGRARAHNLERGCVRVRRELGRSRGRETRRARLGRNRRRNGLPRHALLRALLLRDVERTALTLANFCALKGLSLPAVEAQLEQAQRERSQRPPPTGAGGGR